MSEKRSIAFVVRHPDRDGRILVVQRPSDDEDLPDAWGLPAGSLRPAERWEDAVRRAGAEKLGVELRPGRVLNEGSLRRERYDLRMRLYEAAIVGGEPSVPQEAEGVTQYQGWRWGRAAELSEAAGRGSLCSRLLLEVEGAG